MGANVFDKPSVSICVLSVKAAGFRHEVLPARFEVVRDQLLKTQVFWKVMLCC